MRRIVRECSRVEAMVQSPDMTAIFLAPCSSLAILAASSISSIPKPCTDKGIQIIEIATEESINLTYVKTASCTSPFGNPH